MRKSKSLEEKKANHDDSCLESVNTPRWPVGRRHSNKHEENDNAFVVHMMEPILLA